MPGAVVANASESCFVPWRRRTVRCASALPQTPESGSPSGTRFRAAANSGTWPKRRTTTSFSSVPTERRLAPEFHGEGYGTEAVALLVDYTFVTYDHPAAGAIAYEFNGASRGLLESLGFEEEGRIRRERFIDSEYVDTIHYGLLGENWRGS